MNADWNEIADREGWEGAKGGEQGVFAAIS
jgi:hypothetical protein